MITGAAVVPLGIFEVFPPVFAVFVFPEKILDIPETAATPATIGAVKGFTAAAVSAVFAAASLDKTLDTPFDMLFDKFDIPALIVSPMFELEEPPNVGTTPVFTAVATVFVAFAPDCEKEDVADLTALDTVFAALETVLETVFTTLLMALPIESKIPIYTASEHCMTGIQCAAAYRWIHHFKADVSKGNF